MNTTKYFIISLFVLPFFTSYSMDFSKPTEEQILEVKSDIWKELAFYMEEMFTDKIKFNVEKTKIRTGIFYIICDADENTLKQNHEQCISLLELLDQKTKKLLKEKMDLLNLKNIADLDINLENWNQCLNLLKDQQKIENGKKYCIARYEKWIPEIMLENYESLRPEKISFAYHALLTLFGISISKKTKLKQILKEQSAEIISTGFIAKKAEKYLQKKENEKKAATCQLTAFKKLIESDLTNVPHEVRQNLYFPEF